MGMNKETDTKMFIEKLMDSLYKDTYPGFTKGI